MEMLKLDRELTAGVGRDADDTGIVSAITTLAHILGMTVLAEGVERPEQSSACARPDATRRKVSCSRDRCIPT